MLRAEGDEGLTVDFECGFADLWCKGMQNFGSGLADIINWLAEIILVPTALDAGGTLWSSSTAEAGIWLGLAIVMSLAVMALGLAIALVRQRKDLIIRALIGGFGAFPATLFGYWLVYQALDLVEQFSGGILDKLTGTDGGDGSLGSLFQIFEGETDWSNGVAGSLMPVGNPMFRMLLLLIFLGFGLIMIFVVLAFRDFVLLVLIAFAPLGYVTLSLPNGDQWVKRWASAVIAMLLAKPLVLGTMRLIISSAKDIDSLWSPQGLSLAIGLGLVMIVPMAAFTIFAWVGGTDSGDQAGSRGAQVVKAGAQQAARAVPPRFRTPGGGGRAPAPQRSGANGGGQPKGNAPKTGPGTTQKQGSPEGRKPAPSSGSKPSAGGTPPKPESGQGKPPTSAPKPAPKPPTVPQSAPKQPGWKPPAPPTQGSSK